MAGGILEATTDGDNQSAKIDFLYASGAKANNQNPLVNFINGNAAGETDPTKDYSFHHCMSQISVTFKEGVEVDFETEGITDFSFTNLKLEGSFNTATGEAKADEGAAVSPLTIDLSGATITDGEVSASAICFPQEVSEIELSVTVKGVDYHATLSLPDADQDGVQDQALLPGYNYTYNIIVDKTSLQAGTCTIQPWNDAGRYQNEATNTGYYYDQEAHTYLVYNTDGLYAWASAVQNDMTLNCTIKNTITLPDVPQGESNWTPIGSVDNPYRGTFDATYSPIQNMTIYAPDEDYVGMFRVVSEEGSVWAQLFDVDIIGQNYVGFVGLNNGTVKCYLSGSVTGKQYVGGFTGYNNNQVKTVNGLNIVYPAGGRTYVSGDKYVGGVMGYNKNCFDGIGLHPVSQNTPFEVSGKDYVGGIVGYSEDSQIYGPAVNMYVKGVGNGSYIGGVVGYCEKALVAITMENTTVEAPNSQYVGGLAGKTMGDVIACFSRKGSVTGNNYVGGLVAESGVGDFGTGRIYACYTDSVSIAAIEEDNPIIGNIVGYNQNSIWTSYYTTDQWPACGLNAGSIDHKTVYLSTDFVEMTEELNGAIPHWDRISIRYVQRYSIDDKGLPAYMSPNVICEIFY